MNLRPKDDFTISSLGVDEIGEDSRFTRCTLDQMTKSTSISGTACSGLWSRNTLEETVARSSLVYQPNTF